MMKHEIKFALWRKCESDIFKRLDKLLGTHKKISESRHTN